MTTYTAAAAAARISTSSSLTARSTGRALGGVASRRDTDDGDGSFADVQTTAGC
jgi:hypothetical protein